MITLYGRRNSSNVQRVIWALEEIGVAYERVDVGGSFGGTDAEAYRAMNPTGLVPTLRDRTDGGDLVLWESEAILRYIAARYGAGRIWPDDPIDRARGDQWVAWSAMAQQAAIGPVFFGIVRTPRAEQDWAALSPKIDALRKTMAMFDAAIADGSDHLGGAAFSYADIPAGILTYRYFNMPFERPPLPAVAAWFARLAERPTFQAHIALPLGSCLEEWLEHEKATA